jgi:hypothetical protein
MRGEKAKHLFYEGFGSNGLAPIVARDWADQSVGISGSSHNAAPAAWRF